MRQRKKKWAEPYLTTSPLVIHSQLDLPFSNHPKLHVEIGTGKGDFITTLAKMNPHHFYVGLELQPSVLALAVKKASDLNLSNISFYLANAERLDLLFDKESIEAIYLNFSDPWPKIRHAKRRLTSPLFLEKYHYALKKQGFIYFKTDNIILYEYTLDVLRNSKFELLEKQENYILKDNDVATEYEKRFRALGQPIYRIVMRKKEEL